MNYQTFSPSKQLNHFVKCYWSLEGPKEDKAQRQTIVTDGCMEMIFHYGDHYKQYLEGGDSIVQPKCFVIGQLSRPLEIEPIGITGIFSVRFHPNGFVPFSTIPIKEMEDTAVPLEKLFGEDGQEIEGKILNAGSVNERIKLVEAFLLERIVKKEASDLLMHSTLDLMFETRGQLAINKLSDKIDINRRQLERRFSASTGLTLKQLSKIIRLQSALKMLISKEHPNLTALAYENEYYDQAHFIKDFKEFTGMTPKAFYGEQLKLSSLFISKD